MTDFHTHILPGVDDGSRSVEQSLAMLREERRQGVTEVVLTPHFYAWENSPDQFLARRARAWEALRTKLPEDAPKLRLGAEVQYFEGICAVEGLKALCVQDTGLLLLEMPCDRWTERMIRTVLDLGSRRGMKVVLAHVERCLPEQSEQTAARLRSAGVLFQSNVSCFADWKTRHKAMGMLSAGQIAFLGSDCHDMSLRRPNWDRLPKKAAAIAEEYSILLK